MLWIRHAAVAFALLLGAGAATRAQDALTIKLEPLGGSGISGTAELRPNGDETDFAITLFSRDPQQRQREFDVSLRTGTCEAPGRKIEGIDEVRADGRTEHEDEDVTLAVLRRNDHIVLVTAEDREEALACGAIPRS
jgi:hypothetical protein